MRASIRRQGSQGKTDSRPTKRRRVRPPGTGLLLLLVGLSLAVTGFEITASTRPTHDAAGAAGGAAPNVLLVTIDALRSDRLSVYGYERPTSPHLDRLLARGARFTEARTVEPLTNPALSSMVTSLYPHEHGGTRNGLRMRRGLRSFPKLLAAHGYITAAFVGNWTLKNRLSGLGEHFKTYEEVLSKKRWFGLFKGEADAADLTDEALEWLDTYGGRRRPFLLWVHYVEPHAPYVCHEEYFERLAIDADNGEPSKSDCYDTEIAFVDHHVGRLLATVKGNPRLDRRTLIVFAADHGESLGEHDYWGHGRNLNEPNLHIPFGVVWTGRIEPQVIEAPALLLDVAPTVLGLLNLEVPEGFHGHDWSPVFAGDEAPENRTTWYQAHKGAVLTAREAENARSRGLLQVGMLAGDIKEILEVNGHNLELFNLRRDPGEQESLVAETRDPSAELSAWYEQVTNGLETAGHFPPPVLDEESVEQLKALGYGR
jgi:arylsulfatase A-like enzyme